MPPRRRQMSSHIVSCLEQFFLGHLLRCSWPRHPITALPLFGNVFLRSATVQFATLWNRFHPIAPLPSPNLCHTSSLFRSSSSRHKINPIRHLAAAPLLKPLNGRPPDTPLIILTIPPLSASPPSPRPNLTPGVQFCQCPSSPSYPFSSPPFWFPPSYFLIVP